ncbi:unnamed protein product [Aphanomyces euteiches]
MAKIHDASKAVSIRFSRFSLCYTGLFALKLASTPMLAYLTEPWPWSVPQMNRVHFDSYDAFNNASFAYLQSIYNNKTMARDAVCRFDSATNSYVLRKRLNLPSTSVPSETFLSYLIQCPGMSNTTHPHTASICRRISNPRQPTRRSSNRLFQCQTAYYFGLLSAHACVWLEPLPPETTETDLYFAYFGTNTLEGVRWSWFKMTFRCLLTIYILFVLWWRYCRHYRALFLGLRQVGMGEQYSRYQVIVGDPTYLILSDPFVSLVMIIDISFVPEYIAWSIFRVCQFQDILAFFLGCFYSSRFVWCGYLAMRCLSYLVHRRQWETKFTPIDPGILGIGAFLYGGPAMTLMGNTSIMVLFHFVWGILLPAERRDSGIESAGGIPFIRY